MEDLNPIRAEEALPWYDPGFSILLWDDLNFDNLEFPELPRFTPQECHQEVQEDQEPPVSAQASPPTNFDSDPIDPSLWELISADLGLDLDSQVPNLEPPFSDETATWTPSPGRSIFSQSLAGPTNTSVSPTMLFPSPIPAEPYPALSFESPMPTEPYPTVLDFSPLLSQIPPGSLLSDDWRVSANSQTANDIGIPTLPTISENLQPLPESSTKHTRRRRKKPPTIPARQLRKLLKPSECPICGYGHAYKGDLKKHIASNHPERAHEYQVSTDRTPCLSPGCNKTFARRDHFRRHFKNKHGWL